MNRKERAIWTEKRLVSTNFWRHKTETLSDYAVAAGEVDCVDSIDRVDDRTIGRGWKSLGA